MDKRKGFLFRFIKDKLDQLKMQTHLDERYQENQTKSDAFGKGRERPKHKRVNFKGDGAFRVNDSGEDDHEEAAFRADDHKEPAMRGSDGRKEPNSGERAPMKPCVLKCEKAFHRNGCLFACPLLKKATVDERIEICKRNFICSSCLRRKAKPHDCKYRKPCRHCKGGHNTMLCKQFQEKLLADSAMMGDSSETDMEECDHELVFMSLESERNENNGAAKIENEEEEESVFLVNEQELNFDYDSVESNDEAYDSPEGIFMAITEKRRRMAGEYYGSSNMKMVGKVPFGLAKELVEHEVERNLRENKDDISRLKRLDTAERPFRTKGSLWNQITSSDDNRTNLEEPGEREEERVALVREEPFLDYEIDFEEIDGEVHFTIPEFSTIHGHLCEAAYNLYKRLPRHKIDNFISLTATLPNNNEIKKRLSKIEYPFEESGNAILVSINCLSDTGANIGLASPRMMELPLQELRNAESYLVGSTGICDDVETKQRKLLEIRGRHDKLHVAVRSAPSGLGFARVTPKEVRDSISRQLGVDHYPFEFLQRKAPVDLLVSNKEPEGQNWGRSEKSFATPILSPKLKFFFNFMERKKVVTGIVGLEEEFKYISAFRGRIVDLLWICIWHKKLRFFFCGICKKWRECIAKRHSENVLQNVV